MLPDIPDSYWLLILDGHESHKSLTFQDLCEQSKIITLYMPLYTSYILQLLDVGCFTPLKQAYKEEIRVTEHQLFDFWVSSPETPKIPAIDQAQHGDSGSTSNVH
jgi:hypothetical protein